MYEVVVVNGIMLNKFKYFVVLEKGQFEVKVKIEGENYIYTSFQLNIHNDI